MIIVSTRKCGKHGGKVVISKRMENAVLRLCTILCPIISSTKDLTAYVFFLFTPSKYTDATYEECVHIKGGGLLY